MNATHPLELIRTWSEEQKESVLNALLREVILSRADSTSIPVEDENGQPLGVFFSRGPVLQSDIPKLTPEREAEFARRQANPGQMLSEEEFLEWVRTVDLAPSR